MANNCKRFHRLDDPNPTDDTTNILLFQIKFELNANQTCPQWTVSSNHTI